MLTGSYDTSLADYAGDLGGVIPLNPCTDTTTGYTITSVSGYQCNGSGDSWNG